MADRVDLAQRGGAARRGPAVDAEALGRAEGDPRQAAIAGPRPPPPRRGSWRGCASAGTRWTSCAGRCARAGSRSATSRSCSRARERTIDLDEAADAHRARGRADRAADGAARHADGARGHAHRAGRRGDRGTGARCSRPGFPLVALLQLVRVYAQSLRKIAEAEVRLFHLFVHEPLIRAGRRRARDGRGDGGPRRRAAAADHAADGVRPHRYLRFYIEQDVVGHMEAEFAGDARSSAGSRWPSASSTSTGFTRYTEEEGDEEALDLVERFVETVEATLPAEATIVKTIGDEVMIVSPDPVTLTEWAVGFLGPLPGAPAAAGRDPLRRGRLPRRRLLRARRQPRPPGRRARARRRGDGHALGRRRDRRLRLPRLRADRRGRA